MSKTKTKTRSGGAELRDTEHPAWSPIALAVLPELDIEAGDPRPVIEFVPKDGSDGWAARLTLDETSQLINDLTRLLVKRHSMIWKTTTA